MTLPFSRLVSTIFFETLILFTFVPVNIEIFFLYCFSSSSDISLSSTAKKLGKDSTIVTSVPKVL